MQNSKHSWETVRSEDGILNVDRLLIENQQYSDLFYQYTIGAPQMFAQTKDVARILGNAFDVKLSIHKPNCIEHDLRKLGLPQIPESNCISGFMSRFSVESSKCYIAVAAARPELDIVDIGTVVHEYGHYIEERVHLAERESAYYRFPEFVHRNTSMSVALELISKDCPSLPHDLMHRAADELVAWTNALWVCWLFGIDTQYVILGLVLDKISRPSDYPDFALSHLPKLFDLFTNRVAAEAIFSEEGRYSGFDHFFEQGDELSRCIQIDTATCCLLDDLMYV